MIITGYLFQALGTILVLGSWLLIVIIAFNDDFLWGMLCLVIPPVVLLYIFAHFEDTKYFVYSFLIGGAFMKISNYILS